MRLNHLSLTNFRNYARLELALPERLTLVQGANAQGKTNLLDAIHLLATGRSPRAVNERELVNWLALEGPVPYARLTGEIGDGSDAQTLELVLEVSPGTNGPGVRKQVRINGVPKRALDLVGRLRVVLFLPEDINLVSGAPSERRRYLDIALCQISSHYCRTLAEYNRVLVQRNALLKRLREHQGDPRQLVFWDGRLLELGTLLVDHRQRAVAELDRIAATRHGELTANGELLRLCYLPGVDLEGNGDPGSWRRTAEPAPEYKAGAAADEIRQRFTQHLHAVQPREVAAGTSLIGPHRDDMSFSINGRDARTFGSRGQQRTAALALKMAEVQLMQNATGDSPLLLLDDVMSELDEQRRHTLWTALASVSQAIATTTDWGDFSPELLDSAHRLRVVSGVIEEQGS